MLATYPLDDIWPEVVGKIAAIRQRYLDCCDWREDDVYHACREKRAFLFNSTEDDSFAIVKIKYRDGVKVLFIWIAYGVCGKRDDNLGFLKEIARNVGTSRMEMESPRKGFGRLPEWNPVMTRYSMEVGPWVETPK